MKCKPLPLFNHLFSLSENKSFNWNDFFQFTIIFVFSPMFCIFYILLQILPNSDGLTSLDDLLEFLTMVGSRTKGEDLVTELFIKYDINHDGFLRYSQVSQLIYESLSLWDAVIDIRYAIISLLYTNEEILTILHRKSRIELIKEYKIFHHNKYKPQSCSDTIKRFLLHKEHPDHYDYENSDVTFHYLLTHFIQKYKPDRRIHIERYNKKYLSVKYRYLIFRDIDRFYVEIHDNSARKPITRTSISFSALASERSILRSSTKIKSVSCSSGKVESHKNDRPSCSNTNIQSLNNAAVNRIIKPSSIVPYDDEKTSVKFKE